MLKALDLSRLLAKLRFLDVEKATQEDYWFPLRVLQPAGSSLPALAGSGSCLALLQVRLLCAHNCTL